MLHKVSWYKQAAGESMELPMVLVLCMLLVVPLMFLLRACVFPVEIFYLSEEFLSDFHDLWCISQLEEALTIQV